MAEFKKVVRERNRMCMSVNNDCENCPVGRQFQGIHKPCLEVLEAYPDRIEKAIMSWAEEHPAPKCSLCGNDLDFWDEQEGFGFIYNVGYGSAHDGEFIKARFCCKCFDNLIDNLAKECKHKIIFDMN